MSNLLLELSTMQDAGFNQDDIESGKSILVQEMLDAGFSEDDIKKELGITDSNDEGLIAPMVNYWKDKLTDVKTWAVGNEADWDLYWEKGLGQSTINLGLQYQSQGNLGIDWKMAHEQEPDDTGHIERAFQSLTTIGADMPQYIAGGAIGYYTTGGKLSPFLAGYLNDSVKGMYFEALQQGKVESFKEWWEIYLRHGVWEGVKGGLTLTAIAKAPQLFGATNFMTQFLSRYAAMTVVGSALDMHMPNKDQLINNALILGFFGFAEKGGKMVVDRVVKTKEDPLVVLEKALKNVEEKEDMASKNIEVFRKDKEIEIKKLEKELEVLKKEAPPIKTAKEVEVKPIKEVEVKEETKNIKQKIDEKIIEVKEKETLEIKEKKPTEIKEKEAIEVRIIELKKQKEDAIFDRQKSVAKEIDKEIKLAEKEIKKIETKEKKDVKVEEELLDIPEFLRKQAGEKEEIKTAEKIPAEKSETSKLLETLREKIEKLESEIKDPNTPKERFKEIAEEMQSIRTQLESIGVIEAKEKPKTEETAEAKDKASKIEKIEEKIRELEGKEEPVVEPVEKEITVSDKDAVNKILDNVRLTENKSKWYHNLKTYKASFVTKFLDRLHPIFLAYKQYRKSGGKIKEGLIDPYKKLRLQKGMIGRGLYFLQYGTLKFSDLTINGKSFMKIIKKITSERDYEEFTAYAISKRVVEKEGQGYITGFNVEAAKSVVKSLEGKYEKMFRELNEYQNKLVLYLKDAEVISKETFNVIMEANKDYVPFFRVMDHTIKEYRLGKIVKNPFKIFKGSKKRVIDPLESIFLNTLHYVQIAERNSAFVNFIKMVEEIPDAFPEITKVKARVKPIKVSKEELKDIVIDVKNLSDKAVDGFTVFRREGQIISETQIAIFKKGKMEVWEVGKEIADSLRDINRFQSNLFFRFFGIPTRMLRAGATLAPDFMIKNFNRDTVYAGVFSHNTFIPFFSTMNGLFHMVGRTKLYKEWTKSGAMQSMLVSFDRNYYAKDMKAELTSRKVQNVINPKNWLEMLRIASEFVESASRVGDYALTTKRLKKLETLSDKEIIEGAGFESRDLTIDFRKMGTVIEGYNMVSAFFNARLQGYLKTYEAFRDRPVSTSIKIFTYITLPSILLWMKNHEDERYQRLPAWQKDLFWIIITGEGEDSIVWRVPKPFELGILFGTGAERMLEWIYSKDPDAIKTLLSDFSWDHIKTLSPIPDVIKPFIENKMNTSFFFNKPIIPMSLEGILPEYQYTEYTSETAKLIGKIISDISYEKYGSPAHIDNIINSWTGTLGRYAVEVLDVALKKSGVVVAPTDPKSDDWVKNLADIPIIKALVVRDPSSNSEHITKFWKTYQPLAKKIRTINHLFSQNQYEEAIKTFSETEIELSFLEASADALREMNQTVRMIMALDLESNEKRQMIDQIYLMMIDLAKHDNEVVLQVKRKMQGEKVIKDDYLEQLNKEILAE